MRWGKINKFDTEFVAFFNWRPFSDPADGPSDSELVASVFIDEGVVFGIADDGECGILDD